MSNKKQPKAGIEQLRSVQKEARDYRRFIEESLPVKEISLASSKEKNIRHGNISTLHMWWARRPLTASRATAYAALTPAPKNAEEWQKKRDFIIQLSQWNNSNNQILLERARREILEANGGVPPKVLDPFSGGGSYPLEALRLGCDSYANDYNPVAVLIEKATLEFPQKFGRPFEDMPDWAKPQVESQPIGGNKKKKGKDEQPVLFDSTVGSESTDFNPLTNAVKYWGEWVLEEARKELAEFYPIAENGSIPVGYIWAHTIPCQNPSCRIEIPLMRSFYLANKDKKQVALYPNIKNGRLEFHIVGDGYKPWPKGFDADKGTVSRAVVVCPLCGAMVDDDTTRRLFQESLSGNQMMVVVYSARRGDGKSYRVPDDSDISDYKKTENALKRKAKLLFSEWGINPVPDEPLVRVPMSFGVINVWLYGMNDWGSLYNSRQKLALITLTDKVRRTIDEIISQKGNAEFAKAVCTYLGISLSRLTNRMSTLAYWYISGEKIQPAYVRQGLGMVWDFVEMNPFNTSSGGWLTNLGDALNVIDNVSQILIPAKNITQSSAIRLPYPDNYFDAILTDPPYYDNVPYSYLSDYFYVWLKRSIGHIYPDLFPTLLTPKEGEIVAYTRGEVDGKKFFEDNLKLALMEIGRVLKPDGISVIVYAHKSTSGWETVINALLDSSLIVTSAWPLSTEMGTRTRAQDSATLASSIYIVARKWPRKSTGFYNDVRAELRQHLNIKLHRLWEEGIGGADFFIAAIGSAIEIFGKYEQVMDFEGNIVRADRLLEEVRAIATNYAVKQILHDDFATEVSTMARFYVLWRWNYGEALVPFDEANKLAHSCGMDLSLQFGKNGFIKKERDFARLLGPQGRKLDDLDDPRDMIDVLHKSLLLWEKGQRAEMVMALADRGFGKSEAFYRVAQAISETLPLESKEKKLLDGFLAGRDRFQQEVEKSAEQGKLL